MAEDRLLLTGSVLSFDDDPAANPDAVTWIEDGAVLVQEGKIAWVGRRAELPGQLAVGAATHVYGSGIIMPGFIDGHVHYPQIGVIASHGAQLLEWLERYTFPEEARFSDPLHARAAAKLFLDLLAANGTTTAAVYCTVHSESVTAFFEEAEERGLRMIAGKVLMDRNAPADLRDTAASGYEDSRRLIETWHRRGRNLYAVTPRFAPTSTPAQLKACAALLEEFPDVYLQTHLSENLDEVRWVSELFPAARSYLDVYRRFGLSGPRSLFGHAIHIDQEDLVLASESGSRFVHCPTSNLFMGSGLFDMARASEARIPILLGSDVAGGYSLSPFATMKAAYAVAQASGHAPTPERLFWLSTGGAAKALSLDDRIGRVAPGLEADLAVLDPKSTPLIRHRVERADDLRDVLFAQIVLADDRAVQATYSAGRKASASLASAKGFGTVQAS